jgi:hypothetical protein
MFRYIETIKKIEQDNNVRNRYTSFFSTEEKRALFYYICKKKDKILFDDFVLFNSELVRVRTHMLFFNACCSNFEYAVDYFFNNKVTELSKNKYVMTNIFFKLCADKEIDCSFLRRYIKYFGCSNRDEGHYIIRGRILLYNDPEKIRIMASFGINLKDFFSGYSIDDLSLLSRETLKTAISCSCMECFSLLNT